MKAGVDFTMADIDRLSRRVPCLSKVAPAKSDVHMEDVHRAGGIMAILGELDRAGPDRHAICRRVHSPTMGEALDQLGHRRSTDADGARHSSAPRPAACRRRSPSASRAAGRSSTSTARTA